MTASPIIEAHIVGIHVVNMQVTVGRVVSVRFRELCIAQPPCAAVFRFPRCLSRDATLHREPRATTTTVRRTRHIHNQVRGSGVFANVLAQGVIHDGPVLLVAWRPNLPPSRTRIGFGASPYSTAVIHPC